MYKVVSKIMVLMIMIAVGSVMGGLALAATNSDIVKLVNNSDYALSITQKVDTNGEVMDGGWEQAAHDTYDEQYMVDNAHLVFIEIKGEGNEVLFTKTIPAHSQQMKFDITVNADKTVSYSAQ